MDTVDFNILAASFSQSGKTFSQGDFNYDGSVNTIDFNLLAANFSKSLSIPSASPAAASTPFAAHLPRAPMPATHSVFSAEPLRIDGELLEPLNLPTL